MRPPTRAPERNVEHHYEQPSNRGEGNGTQTRFFIKAGSSDQPSAQIYDHVAWARVGKRRCRDGSDLAGRSDAKLYGCGLDLRHLVPERHAVIERRGEPGRQRVVSGNAELQLLPMVEADVPVAHVAGAADLWLRRVYF